jgi:hypothetical protein
MEKSLDNAIDLGKFLRCRFKVISAAPILSPKLRYGLATFSVAKIMCRKKDS